MFPTPAQNSPPPIKLYILHLHTHTRTEEHKVTWNQWSAHIRTRTRAHTSAREGLSVSNCVVMNILFPLDWAAGSPVCVRSTLFYRRSVSEDGLCMRSPWTHRHTHTLSLHTHTCPMMLWYLIRLLPIVPPGCNILRPSSPSHREPSWIFFFFWVAGGWRSRGIGVVCRGVDRLIYLVMLLVEELCVFIEELCIFAGSHFPSEHSLRQQVPAAAPL